MDWVYSSPRKFYPLNLKDEVTKGIDKISHLVHFINLRSPVLDRIPLRIFLKVGSHLKFFVGSKLGLTGSQVQSHLGYDFPGGKLSEI